MLVVLYGAGSTGRLINHLLVRRHMEIAVVDENPERSELGPRWGVVRPEELELKSPKDVRFMLGIGYQHGEQPNGRRRQLYQTLRAAGMRMLDLRWGPDIGDGTFLCRGFRQHPNSKIGVNCFVGANVALGHDAVIGDHVWVNSGVVFDGRCSVGDQSVIGSNAVIGAGVRVGERCIVAPGVVVTDDLPDDSVILPAQNRIHRFKSSTFMRFTK